MPQPLARGGARHILPQLVSPCSGPPDRRSTVDPLNMACSETSRRLTHRQSRRPLEAAPAGTPGSISRWSGGRVAPGGACRLSKVRDGQGPRKGEGSDHCAGAWVVVLLLAPPQSTLRILKGPAAFLAQSFINISC